MPIDWTPLIEIVRAHHAFLLTSHVRPDCDALGSELAMALILEQLGKQVRIVNGQATPPNLQFLDPARRIAAIGQDVRADELGGAEVLIILDTSAWAQLGPMADVVRSTRAMKLVLDHHVQGDDLGAWMLKDPQAEATGRLVAETAEQLGVALTPPMASALFAALATDTGWYRFSSTTPETYRLAAKLMAAGAQPAAIYRDLYEQDTVGRLRLQGLILSRLVTELNGRLVHTHVIQGDFAAAGAFPNDTEDVINLALTVAGTEVAVIAVEQPEGGCKFSLRSRGQLDCSQLAARFGGGGHKAAAGVLMNQPLQAAMSSVLDAVRAAMR